MNSKGISKRLALCLTAAALFSLLLTPAWAKTVKGVELADKLTIGSATAELVGAGVRYKWFFSVYVGSLYLATPTGDAAAAIEADEAKQIRMSMLRDLGKEKIPNACKEGYEANTPNPSPDLKPG